MFCNSPYFSLQYKPEHGPLSEWCKIQAELAGL